MTPRIRPPARRPAGTILSLLLLLAACGGGGSRDEGPLPEGVKDSPPVPLDAAPAVAYPPDLYEAGVSGTVVLRLFVDENGTVIADSARIEETSGHPGLDSAAIRAAPRLRYAPALKGGKAIAAPFRQPIHFRHPGAGTPTP